MADALFGQLSDPDGRPRGSAWVPKAMTVAAGYLEARSDTGREEWCAMPSRTVVPDYDGSLDSTRGEATAFDRIAMDDSKAIPFQVLSHRTLSILRAARGGRVQMSLSCEPDMFIDGLACSDQNTARRLFHTGLVYPSRPGRIGERVAASLTNVGHSLLAYADQSGHDSVA